MTIKNPHSTGSKSDYDFFLEQYDKFKPLKQITAFFDSENFLLTKYRTDSTTYFVAENWKGDQMHLTNLNCGYGGTGPSTTGRLLMDLGLDCTTANDLKFYAGLTIPFDEKGVIKVEEISRNCIFSSQNKNKDVYLSSETFVNFSERKAYFINPQKNCVSGLFKLIDKINPLEFQYYIGTDSPLDNAFRYDGKERYFGSRNGSSKNVSGVNLIIRGEKLDILCLIDKDACMTVVNFVYYYFFDEPLFEEINRFWNGHNSFWEMLMFSLRKNKTPLQGAESIVRQSDKNGIWRRP